MDFSAVLDISKTVSITDTNNNNINDVGDIAIYTIRATNAGNVTLNSLTVTDTLTDGTSSTLSLSSGPTFISSSSGSATGTLVVGETATYSATFLVNQVALDLSLIHNSEPTRPY